MTLPPPPPHKVSFVSAPPHDIGLDGPLPAATEVDRLPYRWKLLRHRLMADLPTDVVDLIGYPQVLEIVSQTVVDLQTAHGTALDVNASGSF